MTKMKTLDDYLKDPDLTREPAALREVHAIRLMLHDETKNMTTAENTAFYNSSAVRFLAKDNSRQIKEGK